jgi:hypothetical protein
MVVTSTGLYVLTEAGDVWRRVGAYSNWLPIGTVSQVGISGLVVREDGSLVSVTREGEVAASPDGVAWTWIGAIGQLHVMALGADYAPPVGVGPATWAKVKEKYRR